MIYLLVIDNIFFNNRKIRVGLVEKIVWFLFKSDKKAILIKKIIIEKT